MLFICKNKESTNTHLSSLILMQVSFLIGVIVPKTVISAFNILFPALLYFLQLLLFFIVSSFINRKAFTDKA